MADQTFDSQLELLLRSALASEVASLSLSVTADQVLEQARIRRRGGFGGRLRRLGRPTTDRTWPSFVAVGASAVAVVVAAAIGLNFLLNQKLITGPSATATPIATATPAVSATPVQPTVVPSDAPAPTSGPPSDLGIFEQVAGRIVYGNESGIWGVDPALADPTTGVQLDLSTRVQLTSQTGAPLGWSSDGTRLLLQKDDENLFLMHADGSITQVTDQLSGYSALLGSSRPTGATISPDGSRVVFAAINKPLEQARSCHDGALFAVDADGGPSQVLWESQLPYNGIVRDPTFSPDGAQIAVVDGNCDNSHSVWIMNADGSAAHQIVTANGTPLGGGHVYGLAWSPTGDRIALGFEGGIYIFATDGSGFTQVTHGDWPFWSPDGTRIVYGNPCSTHDNSCGLNVADVDGSHVLRYSGATSGPWHPGASSASVETKAQPSPSVDPTRAAPSVAPAATPVWPTSSTDKRLGWSSDGTRLLVQRDDKNLFVLKADGSETQVTEHLSGPLGAAISPDGSRVVFAGLTKPREDFHRCHDGGLFAVNADGGAGELLWTSQIPQNGLIRYPAFSPDGTKIAFADGYCDWGHTVWVMNADGSGAHQIGAPDQAGFVYGVAWSRAGDRVQLGYSGMDRPATYIYWADGSGLTQDTDFSEFCWPWNPC